MNDRDLEVIIKNTDMTDPDELRDVLNILAAEMRRKGSKIKKIEKRIARINAMYPITTKARKR